MTRLTGGDDCSNNTFCLFYRLTIFQFDSETDFGPKWVRRNCSIIFFQKLVRSVNNLIQYKILASDKVLPLLVEAEADDTSMRHTIS